MNADFATYTGHTRRRNHDRSYIAGQLAPALTAARGYLAAVVDGEGNGSIGESVADTLIATLSAVYYHGSAHDDADQALGRALDMSQHALADIMERDGSAGASLAAVIVRAGVAVTLVAGHARCYRWRDGELQLLTEAAPVSASQSGAYTDEGVQVLGSVPNLNSFQIGRYDWRASDRLLLCTDGAWDALTQKQMARLLAAGTVSQAAQALIKSIKETGGRDDATVVVLDDGMDDALGAAERADRKESPSAARHNPQMQALVGPAIAVLVLLLAGALWWTRGLPFGESSLAQARTTAVAPSVETATPVVIAQVNTPAVAPSATKRVAKKAATRVPGTVKATRTVEVFPTSTEGHVTMIATEPVVAFEPTETPIVVPTAIPASAPTEIPTSEPTEAPTEYPTAEVVTATPDKPADATRMPAPQSAAKGVSFDGAWMCAALAGATCAEDTRAFPASNGTVYISWNGFIPDRTRLRIEWLRNGQAYEADICTFTTGRCLRRGNQAHPDVLAQSVRHQLNRVQPVVIPGHYRANIILDDALVSVQEFEIAP